MEKYREKTYMLSIFVHKQPIFHVWNIVILENLANEATINQRPNDLDDTCCNYNGYRKTLNQQTKIVSYKKPVQNNSNEKTKPVNTGF